MVPALREALEPLASLIEVAWLFGSITQGNETDRSDIDLLVLGDAGFTELAKAIHPVEASLRRKINPVLYSAAEFARRMKAGEAFARELLAKPKLFVMGAKAARRNMPVSKGDIIVLDALRRQRSLSDYEGYRGRAQAP